MYRIFKESFYNYQREFEKQGARGGLSRPFILLAEPERYHREKEDNTDIYRNLNDLLCFLADNQQEYPRTAAFLWTLESRGIVPEQGEESSCCIELLCEQAKLLSSFLRLAYWQ